MKLNHQKITTFLLSCFFFSSVLLHGQNTWKLNEQLNFGCHFNLVYGKGQKFPGLKVFAAYNVMAVSRGHFIFSYGPSVSIYTKTIGANLNPLVGDVQIDFTNSFSFGYGWGRNMGYLKSFRTLHTGDFYNVSTNERNMLLLSSNFILNNHHRNQLVGSVTGSFGDVTFNYYNDGAVPFTFIPLADNFDRYWTGGGGIFIHNKKGYNRTELSFDQFTGYTPLLYELSNLIGINIPLYTSDDDKDNKRNKLPSNFNTSTYQLKIFTDRNLAIDAGAIGALVNKKGYHFGVQDLIHMSLNMSLHPNNDMTRFFIGASYNNQQNVK